MSADLIRFIDAIARDRGVDRDLLLQDLEQALVSAARKHFNSLDTEAFGCVIDPAKGEIQLWRVNEEDGTNELIPMESLGRIPAQTAKQVMIQRFRENEKVSVLEEYNKRVGDVITGAAHRYEGGALIVQVDRIEGFMPRSEQIPGEQFHQGDRVRCLIKEVREEGSRVKIILTRRHEDFIRRLFEAEVPEVSEHIIELKAMAREAGFRTKVAVASIDSKVDAVGACVGVRGSRIRNIVDELGGEKIDIVRWNESSQVLIANALKPAEVEDVSLCFELGRATIIVREDQLSLAIGRRGQNVRLAARLTGWDIDILTPEEFAKGLEAIEETVKPLSGIEDSMLDRMGALGMISVFDVEEVGADILVNDVGMSEDLAALVVTACGQRAKELAEQQQKDREEAERVKSEQSDAADAVLGGGPGVEPSAEAAANSILGGAPVVAPTPEIASEEAAEAPEPVAADTEAAASDPSVDSASTER
jgi:N utilization substance protein A